MISRVQSTALLESIAQIAVGLGGYASVVSVFGSNSSDSLQRGWRIRLMIGTSCLALTFALLPLMLEQFTLQDRILWSSCGLLLALGLFSQLAMTFRWMPLTYRKSYFSKPVAVLMLILSTLVSVAVFTAAVVGKEQTSMAVYLMGLIYLLFLTGYNFVRIILAELPIQ